jgi:hypothetical protein
MARHVDEIVGEAADGRDEQIDGSIAKKVYTLISAASAYSIAAAQKGSRTVIVVVWDD